MDKAKLLDAAKSYIAKRDSVEVGYLYTKPFSESSHKAFFTEMYQVLNLIESMGLKSGAAVLEVGSGSGFVTEILVLLGCSVHAVDPAEDMHAIAKERLVGLKAHYRIKNLPPITYHTTALEDGLDLPDATFDGVLFHASLHHIIDEVAGLTECFRLLKPAGILGVSEWAWKPGDFEIERQLEAEMQRFGTLENPFTQEYLDWLLASIGFVDVVRYHAINGLFLKAMGNRMLKDIAQGPASATNILTCIKPRGCPSTSEKTAQIITTAELEIVDKAVSADGFSLIISILAKNTGQTLWVGRGFGAVRVSLFAGMLGSPDFVEAGRFDLSNDVWPGEKIRMTVELSLDATNSRKDWSVGLLSEGNFWFDTSSAKSISNSAPPSTVHLGGVHPKRDGLGSKVTTFLHNLKRGLR
jgi:ubiquinone/menaquinone biosynthesis C-methylase UbiE